MHQSNYVRYASNIFMSISKRPVIIGEVLFDVFENGQAILGGAPFNVAWHLQGFGVKPLFISRLGDDELGGQILDNMQAWGMDISGIQTDAAHKTGIVAVTVDEGKPSFDICNDVAYDHIDAKEAGSLVAGSPIALLYHGSLAARNSRVYDAILQLREQSKISFVDINLRTPWWQRQTIDELMRNANFLKVNDDELMCLTGVKNNLSELIRAARSLLQDYAIHSLILTRGEQGAVIISPDEIIEAPPVSVNKLQDTVGAGDAFSAICILGIMQNWDIPTTIRRATEFAARICQQQGATQVQYDLYEGFIKKWQLL